MRYQTLSVLCACMLSTTCMAACNTLIVDPPSHYQPSDTDGSSYVRYTADIGFLGLGGSMGTDIFSFELYALSHPFMTSTFDLGSGNDTNYATCDECVLIYQDNGSASPKTFFQSAGSLTIATATPPLADPIELHFSDLHLVEVTIDSMTFESIPVPNGACYDVLMDTILGDGFEGS